MSASISEVGVRGLPLCDSIPHLFALSGFREKKRRVYAGFIDLKKDYDRVNREAL